MAAKNFYKNKQILITGGLGFLGSNLAIKLIDLDAKVTIIDALIPNLGGNRFNIFPIKNNIKLVNGDLRDQKLTNKLIKDKEIIFNLAGTLSHIDSMNNPFEDLDINCKAVLCLLEACRKNNSGVKIIFAGTRNQYGKALYLPVDEKHMQEPTDINGINAIAAEKYHLLYSRVYGIKTVSVRISNTYGPRHQMQHSKQGVLNWFIRLLIDGKTVKLFGDGTQIRDINYVDDVVDALLLIAKSKKSLGQIYNLGGDALTLKEFVTLVIKNLSRGKYRTVPYPKDRIPIEVGNYVAETKKIKDELGWYPKVSIDDGIRETINYYQKYKKFYWR